MLLILILILIPKLPENAKRLAPLLAGAARAQLDTATVRHKLERFKKYCSRGTAKNSYHLPTDADLWRRFPNLPYRRFPNRRIIRRLGHLRHGRLGSLRYDRRIILSRFETFLWLQFYLNRASAALPRGLPGRLGEASLPKKLREGYGPGRRFRSCPACQSRYTPFHQSNHGKGWK